jgi:signal transduction histidine kinase
LLITKDPGIEGALEKLLACSDEGYELIVKASAEHAIEEIDEIGAEVALFDMSPSWERSLEQMADLAESAPLLPIVAIARERDWRAGRMALDAGAEDFLLADRISLENLQRVMSYSIDRKSYGFTEVLAEHYACFGILARGVAHVFNNINTTIRGYTEMALDNPSLDDETKRRLRQIHRAAGKGWKLARRLLELSATEPSEVLRTNPEELVRPVLELHSGDFEQAEIELSVELGPKPEIVVDVAQMRRALSNMIANSVHAMIGCPKRQLRIESSVRDDYAAIDISDTGTGIAPDEVTRIFCPFFSRKGAFAPSSPLTSFEGQGLGLSISYAIVRRHGGTINVKSRKGEGTTFRVLIPVE